MELKIKLPACEESIPFLRELVMHTLVLRNIRERKRIVFACNEAVMNSVQAMIEKGKMHKDIVLHMKIYDSEIELNVVDYAGGIPEDTQKKLNQLTFTDMEDSIRGRGLLFIKNIMDELWFRYLENQGFLVGMRAKITIEGEEI